MVLLWITTLTSHKTPPATEIAVFKDHPVNQLDLNLIRLQRPGQDTITLRRIDQQWWLQTPLAVRADEAQVKALQSITGATSKRGFRASGNDLSQYGLEPARLTLWLNDQRLDVGNREPLSVQRYVRVGDQVHLIDDRWSGTLFAAAFAYVSRRLLPENASLNLLQLPHARWNYQRGLWRQQPEGVHAGAKVGVALAAAWSQAQAQLVQPYHPELPWRGELQIGIQGTPQVLRFDYAQNTVGLYLARRDLGLQYLLLGSEANKLLGLSQRSTEEQ